MALVTKPGIAQALAERFSDRIAFTCPAHRPLVLGGPQCDCEHPPRRRPPLSFEDALRRVVALNSHSMTDLEWETAMIAEYYGVSLDYAFARLGAIPEIAEGYPGVEWGEP